MAEAGNPGATWKTLTNTAIEALRPGHEIKDDKVPGLSVRAHPTGKSFMLYYRTKLGVVRRPKIGAWGVLSIAQARDIARGMLAQVAAGNDPVGQREAVQREPKMDDLWRRVEMQHYTAEAGWHKEARRIYWLHLSPRIGARRVGEIDIETVMDVHGAMAKTPFLANRALSVLGKALKLAEIWKMRPVGSNPCPLVTAYPERKRKRYAKPDEAQKVGRYLALLSRSPNYTADVAFLYLLIFSGARPTEIGRATPAILERIERDGRVCGALRIANGKTGERNVFLPPQAMAVLDRLPKGRKALAGRTTVPRRLWGRIRKFVGCDDLWMRDWRRTFATTALSNGVSLGVVGELLGHASAQTTKVYAKLMEDPALAAASDTANHMERMLKGGPSRSGDQRPG